MPDHRNRHWIRSGLLCAALVLSSLSTVWAQLGRSQADDLGGRLRDPAAPEYDLIALRVEFQPDNSRFSTGDGIFGGSMFEGLEPRIDPFPHDEAYFEAHLDFLSNYVRRVSRGQTIVQTHLLPEIVRVSGEMGDYAPTGPDADDPDQRQRLLNLVQEAWTLADQRIEFDVAGLDPERTAFVIFHAGTGRDIELTGTVLDRTPEDLPSLYFGPGDLTGDGKNLSFNNLTVSNTALVPETESKRGVDPISDEPFLLELSINGLVAASFFNYLGAPDLFNTADGSSAIGPYGLMDGLGIFAYGGLLPPEPSGWTRFYLGWTTPTILSGPDELAVELRAHTDQALVPISSTEYFLVEVRYRDVDGDGLNLKVMRDGTIVEQRFDADSDDFTSFNQDGFEGILVDADDFDWALPGGFDDTGELRNGGILIWHIDEQVIADGLESNAVNVDPDRRGVDLEEADSAQDLGFPSSNQFAPDFDRGTPFDFFFEGNPVSSITATGEVALYSNRFGPGTYPNSNSNGGGPSFVVLDGFTPAAASMGFRYSRAAGAVTPIDLPTASLGVPFETGASVARTVMELGPARVERLLYFSGASNSLWFVPTTDGFPGRVDAVLGKPVVSSSPVGADVVAFVVRNDAGEVGLTRFNPVTFEPQFFVPFPAEVRLATPSTPLVGIERGGDVEYFCGFDLGGTGHVAAVRADLTVELLPFGGGGVLSLAAFPDGRLFVFGHERAQLWNGGAIETEWIYPRPLGSETGQAVIGRDALGLIAAMPSMDDNRLVILGEGGRVGEVEVDGGRLAALPILADVNDDRLLEVVVTSGRTLQSFSREGAVTAGFPVRLAAPSAVQPLVMTPADGEAPIVLIGLDDGYLHAYRVDGRPVRVSGFPLAVGGSLAVTPLLTESAVYTASSTGDLYGWSFEETHGVVWGEQYGGSLNQSSVEAGETSIPTSADPLIVASETYNWPNPVREGTTRLRVATTEPSSIEVNIIDLAGNLVYSLEAQVVVPLVPVEFEWRPEVESGVYFARVRADSQSGRRDSKLYSIAVIR